MLQAERLSTTKEAMSSYVQITMEEMAELVDLQMSSELMPTIDSVHALDRCMPLIGACPRSVHALDRYMPSIDACPRSVHALDRRPSIGGPPPSHTTRSHSHSAAGLLVQIDPSENLADFVEKSLRRRPVGQAGQRCRALLICPSLVRSQIHFVKGWAERVCIGREQQREGVR